MIAGRVARLVSDDELIINRGSADGVELSMVFDIVDERTREVPDPDTGENLGAIDRIKTRVSITSIGEHIATAKPVRIPSAASSISSLTAILSGGGPRQSSLTSDAWPEGVEVGDAVVWDGERLNP